MPTTTRVRDTLRPNREIEGISAILPFSGRRHGHVDPACVRGPGFGLWVGEIARNLPPAAVEI